MLVVPNRLLLPEDGDTALGHGQIFFKKDAADVAAEVLQKLNGSETSNGYKLYLTFSKKSSQSGGGESQ